MKQYLIASIIIAILFVGCSSGNEQSITFYDERLELDVLKSLDAEVIPYKKDNSTIWYSTEYGSEVEKLYQEAVNSRPVKYTFYDDKEWKIFIDVLKEMGIKHDVEVGDSGAFTVYVDREKSVEAKKIFGGILVEK